VGTNLFLNMAKQDRIRLVREFYIEYGRTPEAI
jgi:hypothetical protein